MGVVGLQQFNRDEIGNLAKEAPAMFRFTKKVIEIENTKFRSESII